MDAERIHVSGFPGIRADMATVVIDATGLRCPGPGLRMSAAVTREQVRPGDLLEVGADCPSFEADVRSWCSMYRKVLALIRDEGQGLKRCVIYI